MKPVTKKIEPRVNLPFPAQTEQEFIAFYDYLISQDLSLYEYADILRDNIALMLKNVNREFIDLDKGSPPLGEITLGSNDKLEIDDCIDALEEYDNN